LDEIQQILALNQGEAAAVNYGVVELKDKNLFYKMYAYYENYVSFAASYLFYNRQL